MSPLDELRQALTTIDRESEGYEIVNGWLVEELDEPYVNGLTAPSEYHQPLTNDPFVVSAVAAYRAEVRDIIADAIEQKSRAHVNTSDSTNIGYALRLARGINARTEGAKG